MHEHLWNCKATISLIISFYWYCIYWVTYLMRRSEIEGLCSSYFLFIFPLLKSFVTSLCIFQSGSILQFFHHVFVNSKLEVFSAPFEFTTAYERLACSSLPLFTKFWSLWAVSLSSIAIFLCCFFLFFLLLMLHRGIYPAEIYIPTSTLHKQTITIHYIASTKNTNLHKLNVGHHKILDIRR